MSIDSAVGLNRLLNQEALGDEPPILGLVTAATMPGTADATDDLAALPNDASQPTLPVRSALSEVLDDWDSRQRRGESPALRRLGTIHVSRDSGNLYELNEFEQSLRAELDQLVWICLRPLQDLRHQEIVQPVGRVRRPARGAAEQLAAHSEQWERWAPDCPIPREVLASIREDDTDLYENRVTRTLVVGALVHLNRRLLQLRSQLAKNTQGRLVLLSGWFWRQERLRASFDSQEVDFTIEMLKETVDQLEAMVARLAALENSPLFLETAARTRVQSLRITNVLRRDTRYRHIPPLWRLWSSAQDDVVQDLKRLDDPSLSQRGMDTLAEVLAAKALDWLGYDFDESANEYRKGPSSVAVDSSVGVTFLEVRDVAGVRQVRVMALGSPLVVAGDTQPLRNAYILDGWLRAHSDQVSASAILHPADAGDLADISRHQRDLIDHTGLDAVDKHRRWAIIPATPLLVDSLERVTRFLRWQLTAPLFESYPVMVEFGDADKKDRQIVDTMDSVRLDGRNLVILKPLDLDTHRLGRVSKRRPAGWDADLRRAREFFDALLECPIYPTHGKSHTEFKARENGTFICHCRSCRSMWGIDKCGSCGSLIPFARPGVSVPDGELPNDFFGGDLLASLCEGAAATDVQPVGGGPDLRVLICPTCRTCSKAIHFPSCGRCSGCASATA